LSHVDANEILARYIYFRNHYRPSDNTVRYSAFMPPADKRLSVFRTSGLGEYGIWALGESLRPQPLKGRADITVAAVRETGLALDADDIPPRHANIVGWPDDHSAIELKALELSERAHLHLK
jgi:hypothetical protein